MRLWLIYIDKVIVLVHHTKNFFDAIKLMINKQYNISNSQKQILNIFLINIYSNEIINYYESILHNQENTIESQKLEIDKLENLKQQLLEENKSINNQYNLIINSKRWKLINKILKPFGK